MNDRIIKIKAGVDYNIPQFQEYYRELKEQKTDTYYLDYALEKNSIALTNPVVLNDKEYVQYSIDDISFIWENDTIIGHQVINLSKKKSAIYLGHNTGNHLDPNYINNPGYRRQVSSFEYYCKEKIERSQLTKYIYERMNGRLESEIKITNEKEFKK